MSLPDIGGCIYEDSLVFTITSDGYKYLTSNLWLTLQKLNVPWRLCILCLDRESYRFMQTIAMIPCYLFEGSGPKINHKSPLPYGTDQFKRLVASKINALRLLSQVPTIRHLVYLDSDITVFSDPLGPLKEYLHDEPLWFQCDEQYEGGVCANHDHCPAPCTGLIAMRLTDETRPRLERLYTIDRDQWAKSETDQDYIQRRLTLEDVEYKTLNRAQFPNGTFIPDDIYKIGAPCLLHFNYIIGQGKQQSMKRLGYWYVPV
jgi:hypothetical protein